MRSATLRFLDYALPRFLRCDAFTVACGSTLLLAGEAVEGKHVLLKIIAFISKKFSGAAQRWDISMKDAYVIIYSVKELSYYLKVKELVIETDHANLQRIKKAFGGDCGAVETVPAKLCFQDQAHFGQRQRQR